MTEEKKRIFLREATGLVREWSAIDGFIYNFIAIAIPFGIALAYVYGIWAFPGVDFTLGAIICTVGCIFEAVTYIMLASALPRSGGDYVYQSRILHPAIAFIVSFTGITLIDMLWVGGLGGYILPSMILYPLFAVLGWSLNNPSLIAIGVACMSTIAIIVLSLINDAWCAFINIVGMRWYKIMQRITFILTFFTFIIIVALLTITSPSAFPGNFNDFIYTASGIENAYSNIINNAMNFGWNTSPPLSLQSTLMFCALLSFSLTWPAFSVWNAGEIKGAHSMKSQFFQILGSLIVAAIFTGLIGWGLTKTAGYEFLSAASYIHFEHPELSPLPIEPWFHIFAVIMAKSPILIFLCMLCFLAWYIPWQPNGCVASTRMMLAAAFDRILPAWVGEVSDRFHTPVRAILIWTAGCAVFSILWNITPISTLTYAGIFLSLVIFDVTAIAAIIFPWRRREIYEASPCSKYKIFGIPLITIAGIGNFIFMSFLIYVFATEPRLGCADLNSMLFLLGFYVVSAIIFIVAWWYRKKQGIDLSLAFKEIPPE